MGAKQFIGGELVCVEWCQRCRLPKERLQRAEQQKEREGHESTGKEDGTMGQFTIWAMYSGLFDDDFLSTYNE